MTLDVANNELIINSLNTYSTDFVTRVQVEKTNVKMISADINDAFYFGRGFTTS